MATNAEQNQLKQAQDKQQNQQAVPGTGAGQAQQGASRVAAYSSGAQSTTPGSGRFTNLKNYVNANQGAGQQLGSQITSGIDKNVQKTNKEATSAASNIANVVNAEKERLAKGTTFNQQLQDDKQDGASQIYNDQTARDEFGGLRTGQNQAAQLGTQVQSAGDALASGVNNLNQQVGNLGSERGRFALLQQTVKNPNYTQGQQRLDQLMLQAGNPNELMQSQRDLQKRVQQMQSGAQAQFQDLGTQAQGIGTQAEEVAKMLTGTLGQQTGKLVDAQTQEAQQFNTGNAAANAALQRYFTGGASTLTPEQQELINPFLQQANLTTGMRTYNVLKDPGSYQKYLNQGATNLTGQDVVDQNELNRYQSLYNLAGATGNQAFTQVGKGNVGAGIKEDLSKDIGTAEQKLGALLNKDYSKTVVGGTFNKARNKDTIDYLPNNAWYGGNVKANANFSNLLDAYNKNPNDKNSLLNLIDTSGDITRHNVKYYGGSGQEVSPSMSFMGSSDARAVITDDASAADTKVAQDNARKALYQQFLDQIIAQGYQNGLGGVTPVNVANKNFNVK